MAIHENPVAVTAPHVSVLMAVHNGERYLEEALRSMMDQTLRDIEIIVVDDASSDGTAEILENLAAEDDRIRILCLDENVRLTRALNHGLELVRAPLVARMDADDISMPNRLEIQKRFLDSNPEITLIGTSIISIDGEGTATRCSFRPRDSFSVRWLARFAPGIPHPSFMFHTYKPDGNRIYYNEEFPVAQDYELICRLLAEDLELACLPDPLLRYRRHNAMISSEKSWEQRSAAKTIATAFQREELPPELFLAMSGWRDISFEGSRLTSERIRKIFSNARMILAYDVKQHPERSSWVSRQLAQHIASTLHRGNLSSAMIGWVFLRHGPEHILPLIFRAMEIKSLLPRALRSDPSLSA